MSDARLRRLERDAAQGDLRARADLLGERLRLGELAPERLELAARFGDPAARLARCAEAPDAEDVPEEEASFATWLGELEVWREEAGLRVLLAATRHVLPIFARWFPDDHRPATALEAAEAWLNAPGEALALTAEAAGQQALGCVQTTVYKLIERYRSRDYTRDQLTALQYVPWTAYDTANGVFLLALQEESLERSSLEVLEGALVKGGWAKPGELREVIRAALVPWILHAPSA